jgi:hypothetical protein
MELKDRMVECGTCEHRFRVNDEVVVRQKKFYPGERRDTALDRFSRVPKGAPMPSTFQTVQYSSDPVQTEIQSASPLRLVLGLVAGAAVVLVGLLLAFSGSPGGMLDGAPQSKRLALAGFTALIAGIFFIAANPRARIKAIFGSLVAAGALLSLPFVFTEGTTVTGPTADGLTYPQTPKGPETAPSEGTAATDLQELKEEINTTPLDKMIASLAADPANKDRTAVGIWLRDVREFQKLQIPAYIERSTGATQGQSAMYPREGGYLMVVPGVTDDLAELAKLCERFGEVKRVIEPLRVIEVVVQEDKFTIGDLKKLTNKEDPAFYELNRRELESIDRSRAKDAVARLAEAEPKLYRKDINRRLLQWLKESDTDEPSIQIQTQIGRALTVWSEPGDGSEAVVREVISKYPPTSTDLPESLVKFLMAKQDPEAIPLIDALWAADFTRWEELYLGFGPGIEDSVLARFPTASGTMKRSVMRLLAKNGTVKSIPVLEAALSNADSELKVLIDRAIASIRSRN